MMGGTEDQASMPCSVSQVYGSHTPLAGALLGEIPAFLLSFTKEIQFSPIPNWWLFSNDNLGLLIVQLPFSPEVLLV